MSQKADAINQVQGKHSLANMPVTVFASVMGVGALALAWRRAHLTWGISPWPSLILIALAALLFVIVLGAYLAKWIMFPKAARAELSHPIRMAFVPTITIAILVLATTLSELLPSLAAVLWWIGAVGHLLATVLVLSTWFSREDITAAKITPAWLIPIVGNVVTPLAAKNVGNLDLAWFSFGVGMIFWIGFLPLILQRIITAEKQIPVKLLPTIAIMVAPPSIALVSWYILTGNATDPVGRVLSASAAIFAVLVLAQLPTLRKIPFALPYVAYTFPAAAFAVAAIIMAKENPAFGYTVVAIAALAVATLVVLIVITRVIIITVQGKIFLAEK